MSRNLYDAHSQWATRPADERFPDLITLKMFLQNRRRHSKVAFTPYEQLSTRPANDGKDLVLTGKSAEAVLTNWSFRQLCARAGAPSDYLATLPAPKASELLNWGLTRPERQRHGTAQILLLQRGERLVVRAFSSEQYVRVWDVDVVTRLEQLVPLGWTVPPARESQGSKNAGLYAGDRDMFVFMVNESARIKDGSNEGLARGFFLSHSETVYDAWELTAFLYRYVCGNHIVWDVADVQRRAVVHLGDAHSKIEAQLTSYLEAYAESAARPIEDVIKKARKLELGQSDEEVVDLVFSKRISSRKAAQAALLMAKQNESEDGSPWSAWGLSQGYTRASQAMDFAEDRVVYDQASGRVLGLVKEAA